MRALWSRYFTMVRIRGPVFAVLSGLLASAAACSTAATTSAATTRPTAMSSTSSSTTTTTTLAPPSATLPSRIFGISIENLTQLDVATTLGHDLDHKVAIVDFYLGWGAPFPRGQVNRIRAAGAVPEITWEPWNYKLGLHQTADSLSAIAGGSFDAYVQGFANEAKAWGGTLLLRFGHEMNGTWYPWCIGINGNTATDYVSAFRHLHRVMSAATNIRWVWSPNILLPGQSEKFLASLYPGDSYVNYVGIDGYNFGTSVTNLRWLTPDEVFTATVAAVKKITTTKPIIFAEVACSEQGGNKATWIDQMFQFIGSQPRIVGFVWTEFKAKADWPLESSAASLAAMRTGLQRWAPAKKA